MKLSHTKIPQAACHHNGIKDVNYNKVENRSWGIADLTCTLCGATRPYWYNEKREFTPVLGKGWKLKKGITMNEQFYYTHENSEGFRIRSGMFGSASAAKDAARRVLKPGTTFTVVLVVSEETVKETNPLLSKELWLGFKKPGFVFECSDKRAHHPDTTFILMQVSNGKYKLFAPPEHGRYFDDTFDNSQTVQDVVNFLSEQYRSIKVRQGTWQIL